MKKINYSIAYNTIVACLNLFPALALNLLKGLLERSKMPFNKFRASAENKNKSNHYYHLFLIVFCLLTASTTYCQDDIDTMQETATAEVETEKEVTVSFNYENEDIVNIINQLAALKNTNIIFPPGEGINTKLTLAIEPKIPLDEAWNLLITVLDVAGFTMVPNGKTIKIIKNPNKEISREPMPTYIGVSLDNIPQTDQYIRYLCYLSNIKVSDVPENELNGILKDLLPENTLFKADSVTNGLLIVAKANDIHAVMKIITELDRIGFQEKVDILSLNHTSASIVAQLLNEQILKVEGVNPYRLDTKKSKDVPYFSGFTKVIPEERLNKLILLGRTQSVERLKDFIKKYIDVAPDSGKSILHIYRLQYLDATEFAAVLTRIVEGSRAGGPSQARGGEKTVGGVERFFDEVIIRADKPRESEELKYYGGNKLIIAARGDDWKQIKKLIEELDSPQPQVLIEVLIADLTINDLRMLGAMTRTPDKISLPDSIGFQAAMLANALPNQMPNPTTIDSDLLSTGYATTGAIANPSTDGVNSVASFATAGTTMLSLNDNDGKTWSILELLQVFTHSKILSHPHVVATNNKEASIKAGEQRYLPDAVTSSQQPIINYKKINANLEVKITPRISSGNTVNLQVLININDFLPGTGTQNAQTVRKLGTNANIKSGGIFALGGLIRTNTITSTADVPFLGKIPVLGWFFKRRSTRIIKNNLTVFICPTIIEPRLRGGMNQYTQDYIEVAENYTYDGMFTSLKDPITRWFFVSDVIDSTKTIDDFNEKTMDSDQKKSKKKKIGPSEAKMQYVKNDTANGNVSDTAQVTQLCVDTRTVQPEPVVQYNEPTTQFDKLTVNSNPLPDLKKIIQNDPNPFLKA